MFARYCIRMETLDLKVRNSDGISSSALHVGTLGGGKNPPACQGSTHSVLFTKEKFYNTIHTISFSSM